jgi:ribonuclease HI
MQHRTWCQRRGETARILENKCKHHIKIYTDGSKKEDRVGYSVIWNQQKNKIFSAEQGAILSAIYATMVDPQRKVIATDSLSTLLAASDKKVTKNPKTRQIRKLLKQEGDKITLLWVPSHVGIQGNEKADSVAKEALDEQLDRTKEYPPQDLTKWITGQLEENQQTHWEQNGSEMRNQKPHRTNSIDNHEAPPECFIATRN